MIKKRTIVLAASAVAACILCFTNINPASPAPPDAGPATGGASDSPSPRSVATSQPIAADRETQHSTPTTVPAVKSGHETPGEQQTLTDTSGFPSEYTGIRDKNLLGLYSTFQKSVRFEGEKLATANESDLARGIQLNYLESSAYISLIQSQRLYYYGYARPKKRPPNTRDSEYHLTGAGGLFVIFELTRQEFPDLFAAKDVRAEDPTTNSDAVR